MANRSVVHEPWLSGDLAEGGGLEPFELDPAVV